jgi:hypothetical protein
MVTKDEFKQPDPETFYPNRIKALDMEAAETMHHISTTPWTNRIPPGAVVVPKAATQDPEQRAILEKDFVILDESHPLSLPELIAVGRAAQRCIPDAEPS